MSLSNSISYDKELWYYFNNIIGIPDPKYQIFCRITDFCSIAFRRGIPNLHCFVDISFKCVLLSMWYMTVLRARSSYLSVYDCVFCSFVPLWNKSNFAQIIVVFIFSWGQWHGIDDLDEMAPRACQMQNIWDIWEKESFDMQYMKDRDIPPITARSYWVRIVTFRM